MDKDFAEMKTAAETYTGTGEAGATALQGTMQMAVQTMIDFKDRINASHATLDNYWASTVEKSKILTKELVGDLGPQIVTSIGAIDEEPKKEAGVQPWDVADGMAGGGNSSNGTKSGQELRQDLTEQYGLTGTIDLLERLADVYQHSLGSDYKKIRTEVKNCKMRATVAAREADTDVDRVKQQAYKVMGEDEKMEREFAAHNKELQKDFAAELKELDADLEDGMELVQDRDSEMGRTAMRNTITYDNFAERLKDLEKVRYKFPAKSGKAIERLRANAKKVFEFLDMKDKNRLAKMQAIMGKTAADVGFDGSLAIGDEDRSGMRAIGKFDRVLADAEKRHITAEKDLKTELGIMMHRMLSDIDFLIEENKDRIGNVDKRRALFLQQGRVTESQLKDLEASQTADVKNTFEPYPAEVRKISQDLDYQAKHTYENFVVTSKDTFNDLQEDIRKDWKGVGMKASTASKQWADDISAASMKMKKMDGVVQENTHNGNELGLEINNAQLGFRSSKDQMLEHVQRAVRDSSKFAARINVALRALAKLTYADWDRVTGVTGSEGLREVIPAKVHQVYGATMERMDKEEADLMAQLKVAKDRHVQWKDKIDTQLHRIENFGAASPGEATIYEQIYHMLAKDVPEAGKAAQVFANWAQGYVNNLATQEYNMRSYLNRLRRAESARVKANLKKTGDKLDDQERQAIKDETKTTEAELGKLRRQAEQTDNIAETRAELFEKNMNEINGVLHGVNMRVKNLGGLLEPAKEDMWAADQYIGDESLDAKNSSYSRALDKAETEVGRQLRHEDKKTKDTVEQTQERELSKLAKERRNDAASAEGRVAEIMNLNREVTSRLDGKASDEKDRINDMGRGADHSEDVLTSMVAHGQQGTEEITKAAASDSAKIKRLMTTLSDQAQEDLQQVLEGSRGGIAALSARTGLARNDLEALRRALEAQDLDAIKALTLKVKGELHHDRQAMAHGVSNAERGDEATSRGLKTTEERWKDAEARLEVKSGAAEAELRKIDGTQQNIERSSGRISGMNERTGASVGIIGADVGDIGSKAAAEMTVEGEKVEADARIASMGIESSVDRAQSTQELMLHNQQNRDEELAQAVGGLMALIQEGNQDAVEGRNKTELAEAAIQKLVQVETDTIKENADYLKKFQSKTTFEVLNLLGPIVKSLITQDHKVSAGYATQAAGFHAQEAQADQILGSEAVQTLQKVGKVDNYAHQVMVQNDELADWMQRFHEDTNHWRPKIEKALTDEGVAIDFHHQQVDLESLESAKTLKASQEHMLTGLNGMIGGMGDGKGQADGVLSDMYANFAAMVNSQKMNGLNDDERIRLLQAAAARWGPRADAAMAAALAGMKEANAEAADGRSSMSDMVNGLKVMTANQEAAVGKERDRLNDKLSAFQNTLYGVTGDPQGREVGALDALKAASERKIGEGLTASPVGRPLPDGLPKNLADMIQAGKDAQFGEDGTSTGASPTAMAQKSPLNLKLDSLIRLLETLPKKSAKGGKERQLAMSVLQKLVAQAKDLHEDHKRLAARHEAVGGVIRGMLSKVVSGLF